MNWVPRRVWRMLSNASRHAGLLALAAGLCTLQASADGNDLRTRLQALQAAYPDHVRTITGNVLVMRDGTRLVIDDGKAKDHQAKLASADIEDMLSQTYPIGKCDTASPPARNADPGRIRVGAFFADMYGKTKRASASRLVTIDWFGTRLRVTRINGVADKLMAIRDDLAKLPRRFRTYLENPGGTYNWRTIAGTDRLSVHSFGAAIDLNTRHADYWRWSGGKPGRVGTYRNRIPREIVTIFERHGFIWGGKWYHYDTMHFEYRPAVIALARRAEQEGCRLDRR